MSQEADNIILNSIPPKDIPIRPTLNGTEWGVFYVDSSGKLERSLTPSLGNFITINGNVFRLIKGYTGAVLNTGLGQEVNDFLTDGVVLVSGSIIRVYDAQYIGGSITDFGTYDNVTKKFTGGSYLVFQHKEI